MTTQAGRPDQTARIDSQLSGLYRGTALARQAFVTPRALPLALTARGTTLAKFRRLIERPDAVPLVTPSVPSLVGPFAPPAAEPPSLSLDLLDDALLPPPPGPDK
jgi:hypothetical protein